MTVSSISIKTGDGRKPGLALREFVESSAQAFEAGAKAGGLATDADAEVLRHLKEFSGDDGGFILFAEQFEKCVWDRRA